MKVRLVKTKIRPDNGVPSIIADSDTGIELPDELVLQYENAKAMFTWNRDQLIEAYKGAGGEFNVRSE